MPESNNIQSDNKSGEPEATQDASVKEGKKAIDAARIAEPKPADQQQEEEAKDAERWRSEG